MVRGDRKGLQHFGVDLIDPEAPVLPLGQEAFAGLLAAVTDMPARVAAGQSFPSSGQG